MLFPRKVISYKEAQELSHTCWRCTDLPLIGTSYDLNCCLVWIVYENTKSYTKTKRHLIGTHERVFDLEELRTLSTFSQSGAEPASYRQLSGRPTPVGQSADRPSKPTCSETPTWSRELQLKQQQQPPSYSENSNTKRDDENWVFDQPMFRNPRRIFLTITLESSSLLLIIFANLLEGPRLPDIPMGWITLTLV